MTVNHKKMKLFFSLFLMDCTQKHTAGFNSHYCSGRKVDDSDKSFAYKLFGLIESVDAAQYSAVCSRAVVKRDRAVPFSENLCYNGTRSKLL